MNSGIQKPVTAENVMQLGYNYRRNDFCLAGHDKLDVREFFDCLKESIIKEYRQQGFCELIDNIIANRYNGVDVVAAAAIMEACVVLEGKQSAESAGYIPYISIPDDRNVLYQPTWDDFRNFKINDKSYNFIQMQGYLLQLRKNGREAHMALIKELKTDRERHDSIAAEERREAKQILEDAKKEADDIVSQAKNEADGIVRLAKGQAEEITAHEEKPKNQNTDDDHELEETLLETKEYLEEKRCSLKKEVNEEIAAMLMERDKEIELMEKKHNDMRDATDSLHAAWSQELTRTIDNLSKMKKELYDHIHNWQISLYPYEIKPLAQCFISLYNFIYVDRIMDQEVLFGLSQSRNSDEREFTKRDMSKSLFKRDKKREGQNEDLIDTEEMVQTSKVVSKNTIDSLQKLNHTLTIFLKKFEAALNGVGMVIYYPKEGDLFDPVFHILENEEDELVENAVIKRCIIPGVARKIVGDDEKDVIIKAIVEL